MKYSRFNEVLDDITNKQLTTWLDKLKFHYIFLIWGLVITLFGVFYHFAATDLAYLHYGLSGKHVTGVLDSVYFSLITATATGFGDIVPVGYFKAVSLVEIIFGLLLLAVVTSKLVSIKQHVILGEVYELSIKERITSLRSSLARFRRTIDRTIIKVEEKTIRTRELDEVHQSLAFFEDTLNEIYVLSKRSADHHFIKNVDTFSAELILNSILDSWEKLTELILILKKSKHTLGNVLANRLIERSLGQTENIFRELGDSQISMKETFTELEKQRSKISGIITAAIH